MDAKKIKKRLIDDGLSQTALAEQIGVSPQQLNNVLNGRVDNDRLKSILTEYARSGTVGRYTRV